MFETIKKDSVPEKVVNYIMDLLIRQELKDGDRLLPERELAENLFISRATLRESFKILNLMGIVEKRQDGTYIRINNSNILKNSLKMQLYIEKSSLIDLIEARELLEIENAGLAAQRATDIEIEMLEKLYATMEKYQNDLQKYVNHNVDFHLYIAKATGNSLLFEVFYAIRELLLEYQQETHTEAYMFPGSMAGHRNILDAIKVHDVQKAKKAMTEHLKYSKDMFFHKIDEESQRENHDTTKGSS